MRRANVYVILVSAAIIALFALTAFLASPTTALQLAVSTDKVFYAAEEPVHIDLRVTNAGTATIELTFSSSCQAAFMVQDFQGNPLFDSSKKYACLFVFTHLTLAPGASHDYGFTWDQTTTSGSPVATGEWYRVLGGLWSHVPVQTGSATIFIGP